MGLDQQFDNEMRILEDEFASGAIDRDEYDRAVQGLEQDYGYYMEQDHGYY